MANLGKNINYLLCLVLYEQFPISPSICDNILTLTEFARRPQEEEPHLLICSFNELKEWRQREREREREKPETDIE